MATIGNQALLMRLPQRQTLLRDVNRAQNRTRPLNPHTLAFDVVAPYDMTLNDEFFLQYDSGQEGEDR